MRRKSIFRPLRTSAFDVASTAGGLPLNEDCCFAPAVLYVLAGLPVSSGATIALILTRTPIRQRYVAQWPKLRAVVAMDSGARTIGPTVQAGAM